MRAAASVSRDSRSPRRRRCCRAAAGRVTDVAGHNCRHLPQAGGALSGSDTRMPGYLHGVDCPRAVPGFAVDRWDAIGEHAGVRMSKSLASARCDSCSPCARPRLKIGGVRVTLIPRKASTEVVVGELVSRDRRLRSAAVVPIRCEDHPAGPRRGRPCRQMRLEWTRRSRPRIGCTGRARARRGQLGRRAGRERPAAVVRSCQETARTHRQFPAW